MALPPGTRLGPYEIVAAIGAGGMGEVYKARDVRLDRDVAIKTLPADVASDPDRLRRFETEAQAIAAVSHPNLLAIYDIGHEGPVRYLVTELLQGQTLRDRLAAGPLDLREAIAVGRQVAAGVASAHARGIVHRDLKPENIFLTRDGFAKVLDFGLAKVTPRPDTPASRHEKTQSTPGLVLGTPGYMPPEQRAGRDADERSDVFAAGAVLFESLAGRRALDAKPSDTLAALLDGRPLDYGLAGTGLDGPVGHIVRRCLEHDPRERYQSMTELHLALEGLAAPGVPPSAGAGTRPGASIAVLPFADMSADKSQAYFCEGMAEEIINALARVDGLRVAARTSTFQLAREGGTGIDLAGTARSLGVKTVLEGSVRTSGPKLRVTAQLIDADAGRAIWSDRFDGELADVFDIQDRIAASIVDALRVKLLGRPDPLPGRQTRNLEAYHAYLKGRHHRFTTYNLREAYTAFRQATDLDPSYAAAHAGVAYTVTVLGNYGFLPPQEARSQALAAIEQALALDPQLAQAHAARAYFMLLFDQEWERAEALLTFALELDPRDVEAYVFFGFLHAVQGRAAEATRLLGKACELEPFSAWTRAVTGMALMQLGEFEAALHESTQALEARPDSLLAQVVAGMAMVCLGRHDAGLSALERAVAAAPTHHWIRCSLGAAYGLADRVEDAERVMDDLADAQLTSYVSPAWLALVPASLGRSDEALGLFDLEIRSGGAVTTFLRTPILGKLRSHPRYHAMLARLRLPPL